MTVLFVEGFDHQNDATDLASGDDWTSASDVSLSASYARFIGKGCACSGSGVVNLAKTFSESYTALTIGFAIQQITQSGDDDFALRIYDSGGTNTGNIQLWIAFGGLTNGDLTIWSNNSDTVLLSLPEGFFQPNIWYYVELVIVIGTANGSMKVLVNGAQHAIADNINTNPTGVGDWQSIDFRNGAASPYLDDLYATDGSSGPYGTVNGVQVETLFPNANSGSQGFSPSPNTNVNWQNVSETAMDGDTTYNYSPTLDVEDLFTVGALSNSPVAIYAAAIRSAARIDNTSPVVLENRIVSNGTESDGAPISLGSSYAYQTDILATDPNTNVAWTATGINGVTIGYKISSL